jgi:hypothetical protein
MSYDCEAMQQLPQRLVPGMGAVITSTSKALQTKCSEYGMFTGCARTREIQIVFVAKFLLRKPPQTTMQQTNQAYYRELARVR